MTPTGSIMCRAENNNKKAITSDTFRYYGSFYFLFLTVQPAAPAPASTAIAAAGDFAPVVGASVFVCDAFPLLAVVVAAAVVDEADEDDCLPLVVEAVVLADVEEVVFDVE